MATPRTPQQLEDLTQGQARIRRGARATDSVDRARWLFEGQEQIRHGGEEPPEGPATRHTGEDASPAA